MPFVNPPGAGGGVGGVSLSLVWKTVNLTSQIDGITALFTIPDPYVSGRLIVILDTLVQNGTAGYITETSPGAGTFTLGAVPIVGQTLFVMYIKNG